MKLRTPRSVRLIAALLVAPVAITPMLTAPAYAQFGFGGIVYDPSNYAQNVLTRQGLFPGLMTKHMQSAAY